MKVNENIVTLKHFKREIHFSSVFPKKTVTSIYSYKQLFTSEQFLCLWPYSPAASPYLMSLQLGQLCHLYFMIST